MALVVSLPVYEDHNQFSIWPAEQSVTSCYGLISSSPVTAPVATGRVVTVPYYRGYRYVAFQARNKEEVRLFVVMTNGII